MKAVLFIICFCTCCTLIAQNFQGTWKGSITRDYGDEIKTDSIHFNLQQEGFLLKGYSLVYVDSVHYIRAAVSGDYNASTKIIRLIETTILENNIPRRGEEITLDKYVISYDPLEPDLLYGKSISRDIKQGYARSVMNLKR